MHGVYTCFYFLSFTRKKENRKRQHGALPCASRIWGEPDELAALRQHLVLFPQQLRCSARHNGGLKTDSLPQNTVYHPINFKGIYGKPLLSKLPRNRESVCLPAVVCHWFSILISSVGDPYRTDKPTGSRFAGVIRNDGCGSRRVVWPVDQLSTGKLTLDRFGHLLITIRLVYKGAYPKPTNTIRGGSSWRPSN